MKKRIGVVVAGILLIQTGVFAKGGAESKSGAAGTYPQKALSMICPWSAGGGTDAVLRALSAAAEKQLGVSITVENKTGGAGAIGHAAIKNARPDGYTLGMITFELNSLPQQGLIDFTYADFDPLIRVNADAATLTVKADAPYNSVQEFVDYCKQNPGAVSIGNSAPGSVWHIGAGLLANETGITVKHIAFEGAAPAVTALAGGHIQAVSVSLAEVKSQLDAGNVKCLGIMDTKRSPLYPDIPTFIDQGYNITYSTWRGLALPKGVDPAIKTALVNAFTLAMQDPAFITQAKNLNLELAFLGPEEFASFLKTNFDAVTKTLQETHLLDE
ncbi:MAG: tripartite tricarboxylate transporter substrate binding protein [Treponema sp.]|jgi:tripartite-type tricarboxylate transporter receptor subunit TctC|nr:tripartite tricarboxylate transporter substrate binding protein [Treponema sp.]